MNGLEDKLHDHFGTLHDLPAPAGSVGAARDRARRRTRNTRIATGVAAVLALVATMGLASMIFDPATRIEAADQPSPGEESSAVFLTWEEVGVAGFQAEQVVWTGDAYLAASFTSPAEWLHRSTDGVVWRPVDTGLDPENLSGVGLWSDGKGTVLAWSIEGETGDDHTTIVRSTDGGVSFEPVGRVKLSREFTTGLVTDFATPTSMAELDGMIAIAVVHRSELMAGADPDRITAEERAAVARFGGSFIVVDLEGPAGDDTGSVGEIELIDGVAGGLSGTPTGPVLVDGDRFVIGHEGSYTTFDGTNWADQSYPDGVVGLWPGPGGTILGLTENSDVVVRLTDAADGPGDVASSDGSAWLSTGVTSLFNRPEAGDELVIGLSTVDNEPSDLVYSIDGRDWTIEPYGPSLGLSEELTESTKEMFTPLRFVVGDQDVLVFVSGESPAGDLNPDGDLVYRASITDAMPAREAAVDEN